MAIKPGLALGSWAAFLGTDDNAMVMGDLVLLEEELNPVTAKLRFSDFDITAVHNHLMEETPKVLVLPVTPFRDKPAPTSTDFAY